MLLLANSCKKSKQETTVLSCNPKYSVDIQPIITSKCALSGCHNAGSSMGDYTKFEVVKVRADSGRINHYVFDLRIMPPANKDSLTTTEKNNLKCWLDNGALQN